jgi:hypothetical protein
MQLIQKHLPRKNWVKPVLLFCLLICCKPYLHSGGFDLTFDYRTGLSRIQHAGAWLATQVASQFQDSRNVKYREATK